MSDFFFYFFATILVLSALTVVLARNPLYNVLSLVVASFSLASLFMHMEAFFVGVILLLVYAGAVVIFFLFVVMCLNLSAPVHTTSQQNRFKTIGWLIGLLLATEFYIVIQSFLAAQNLPASSIRGTVENVGILIFTDYLLPFELTSFILFIAIFGIVSLAKGAMESTWDKKNDAKKALEKS
ncbi:MAG: NADH-quinone oxidoreductase subunit J [Candidatus Omnitrophica bacterium]|nr:NADH-quinone oxidoreductase subunit J [Candidatus Omnitrophota bacterium]